MLWGLFFAPFYCLHSIWEIFVFNFQKRRKFFKFFFLKIFVRRHFPSKTLKSKLIFLFFFIFSSKIPIFCSKTELSSAFLISYDFLTFVFLLWNFKKNFKNSKLEDWNLGKTELGFRFSLHSHPRKSGDNLRMLSNGMGLFPTTASTGNDSGPALHYFEKQLNCVIASWKTKMSTRSVISIMHWKMYLFLQTENFLSVGLTKQDRWGFKNHDTLSQQAKNARDFSHESSQ